MQELKKDLTSSHLEQRIHAIEQLAQIGSSEAISSLFEYLNTKETYVNSSSDKGKVIAIEKLAQIKHEAVLPALIKLLKDNPKVSANGYFYSNTKMLIKVLGEMKAHQAASYIVPLLRSPYSDLVETAIEALNALHWQPTSALEKVYWLAAHQNWDAITNLGEEAVTTLITITPNIHGKHQLKLALAKIGSKNALDHLLKLLFTPLFVIHHRKEITDLIPYFEPMFGELTEQVLLASSFIDYTSYYEEMFDYYSYSLETAIEATKALQESNTILAKKILAYVANKKPVSLIIKENVSFEISTESLFGFEEQQQV